MGLKVLDELGLDEVGKERKKFEEALANNNISAAMKLAAQSGIELSMAQDAMNVQTSRSSMAMSLLNDKIKLLDSNISTLTQSLQKSALQPLREQGLDRARISSFDALFGNILGPGGPLSGIKTDREAVIELFKSPEKLQEVFKLLPNVANTQFFSDISAAKTGAQGQFYSAVSGTTNEQDAKIIATVLGLKQQAGTVTVEKFNEYIKQLVKAGGITTSIEQMQLDKLDYIAKILINGFRLNRDTLPLPRPATEPNIGLRSAVEAAVSTLPKVDRASDDLKEVVSGLNKVAEALSTLGPNGVTKSDISVDVVVTGLQSSAKSEIAKQTVVAFLKKLADSLDVNDPAQAQLQTTFRNAIRSIEGTGKLGK
jgi:hypothetical protein